MAEKKFAKGTEEWMMFMDFWNYTQKYWIPEDDPKYWETIVNETNDFIEKYKMIPLANALGVAFLKTQENIIKKNK